MTLKELRDQIRSKSGLTGSDTFIGFIDGLINEQLHKFTSLRRFPEMYLPNTAILAVGSATVVLPTNVQHLDLSTVQYDNAGTFANSVVLSSIPAVGATSGVPNSFVWSGTNLLLYPQTVGASASVWINYWKIPTTLLNDTDVFPIVALIETVKYACVDHCARLTDAKLATLAKDDRNEAWSASQAIVRN